MYWYLLPRTDGQGAQVNEVVFMASVDRAVIVQYHELVSRLLLEAYLRLMDRHIG